LPRLYPEAKKSAWLSHKEKPRQEKLGTLKQLEVRSSASQSGRPRSSYHMHQTLYSCRFHAPIRFFFSAPRAPFRYRSRFISRANTFPLRKENLHNLAQYITKHLRVMASRCMLLL
jgi:hypothetical protein